ncbi:cytochrome O ubiquinol oxidase [Streptococcus equinus]|uniref:cytochrome O ubiquinol oxidase n=1 Tax=Streptococcus equinus TaxID=1335 RepID=UPI00106FD638|nr:cytochrome O ubiquinol oxidase [Streptococcus equinus]TFH45493.1 cytochrome O ubiquinol oxidase [Streptococcus equinus]
MLDFVKVHLSTILLTSATFVLTLIYLAESKWTITIVWALVTLINIARLSFAYFKK